MTNGRMVGTDFSLDFLSSSFCGRVVFPRWYHAGERCPESQLCDRSLNLESYDRTLFLFWLATFFSFRNLLTNFRDIYIFLSLLSVCYPVSSIIGRAKRNGYLNVLFPTRPLKLPVIGFFPSLFFLFGLLQIPLLFLRLSSKALFFHHYIMFSFRISLGIPQGNKIFLAHNSSDQTFKRPSKLSEIYYIIVPKANQLRPT